MSFVEDPPPPPKGVSFVERASPSAIPGLEKLGTPAPAGQPPKLNALEGNDDPSRIVNETSPLIGMMGYHGGQQVQQGAMQMSDPGLRNKAGGLSNILRGVGQIAAPMAAPMALAAAPVATVGGMAAGGLAGAGTESALNAAGVAPEYSALAGDAAGIAGGTLGAKVAPRMLSKLGGALQESAQTNYGRALGPTTQENKLLTQRQVAPGLIDRGVTALTRKGLQNKIAAAVDDWGQQVGDAIDNLPPNASLPLGSVAKAVDAAGQKQFMIDSPNGPVMSSPDNAAGLAHLDQLKNVISAGATQDANGNTVVDSRYLRQLRQAWDEQVSKGKGFTTNDLINNAKLAAYRTASNAIREQFAQAYPDIAEINKQYSFWKNAQKVIDATVTRTQSQSKPLGRQLARTAMAGVGLTTGGPVHALAGYAEADALMGAIQSTGWRTASAVMKDRLADALLSGNQKALSSAAAAIVSAGGLDVLRPARTEPSKTDQNGIPLLTSPENQP